MNKAIQIILLTLIVFCSYINGGCSKTSPKRAVNESSRDIPVAYDVDVVVVGGTSGGVAAAVEAAQNGAKVFLAAQRPYLGADLCATYPSATARRKLSVRRKTSAGSTRPHLR